MLNNNIIEKNSFEEFNSQNNNNEFIILSNKIKIKVNSLLHKMEKYIKIFKNFLTPNF